MALPRKTVSFLEKKSVKYEILEHRTIFTAFDKAKTLKVDLRIVAKTLVLRADKDLIIVLIPALKNLDKQRLKILINGKRKKNKERLIKKIDFATEKLIKSKIKGVKLGVIPPFGEMFGLLTFIDNSLLKNKFLILNSGDNSVSLKIKSSLFEKIVSDLEKGNFSKKRG